MATRNPTITRGSDGSWVRFSWAGANRLANADDGAPIGKHWVQFADRSVQVLGTFGAGGNLRVEGSNDGGTTYAALNDPQGNALDITLAKAEQVLDLTQNMRPRATAGDGTTLLEVHILCRRQRQAKE